MQSLVAWPGLVVSVIARLATPQWGLAPVTEPSWKRAGCPRPEARDAIALCLARARGVVDLQARGTRVEVRRVADERRVAPRDPVARYAGAIGFEAWVRDDIRPRVARDRGVARCAPIARY